jgi:hypothetical protein
MAGRHHLVVAPQFIAILDPSHGDRTIKAAHPKTPALLGRLASLSGMRTLA